MKSARWGLTQQELADKIGKTESSIRKYEKGVAFPKSSTVATWERGGGTTNDSLIGLALYFDVTTDYLLGLSDEMKPKQKELSDYSTDELMNEVLRRWL